MTNCVEFAKFIDTTDLICKAANIFLTVCTRFTLPGSQCCCGGCRCCGGCGCSCSCCCNRGCGCGGRFCCCYWSSNRRTIRTDIWSKGHTIGCSTTITIGRDSWTQDN